MFFYLGKNCDLLYKQEENLFTDLGWSKHLDVYYKGYTLDCDLKEKLSDITEGFQPQGIYAVIHNKKLYHSYIRPFPLYTNGSDITNLKLDKFDELPNNTFDLPNLNVNYDKVIDNIIDIISINLTKFNLEIWCTGGIDSTLLIALAEYNKINYTIHIAKPKDKISNVYDFEGTYSEYNNDLLKFCRDNYWAYGFLSNFKNKILTTGFYGDEYFCRTLWQIKILANASNKSPFDLVKHEDYIFYHLHKPQYRYLNNINSNTNGKESAIKTIGKSQIWHFDNTITFCPLMDKKIVDNVFSLDSQILLECGIDAKLQKDIILKTKPDILKLCDSHKNTIKGRHNFFENISSVKLNYCTDIKIY